MAVRALATVVLAIACMGCTSDSSSVDGGTGSDGGGVDTPADIPWLAEGAPPVAAPTLTPCPDGWREVTDESGVTVCDPFPAGGPIDCPAGQAHFPGEAGCTALGASCPTGDFAEGLPTDRRVVYVRPGAAGGDGTEASPYGSLTEFSIGGLPAGTVIALSRGTHDGPVPLVRGHVLRGACVAETTLRALTPAVSEGVVTARAEGGEIRDLTIADSPRSGIWLAEAGAEIRVESVVVTGASRVAVIVGRGSLFADRLVVRGTRGDERGEGRGLGVELAATATVSRALFEHNLALAVRVSAATLTMSDVAVRDTEGALDGSGGRGLEVARGASADISRALFEANRDHGVFAHEPGTMLTLTDVIVRDTRPAASDDMVGRGLGVEPDAIADVRRAVIERNHDVGVFVGGAEAAATLTDVVVRDTQPEQSDGSGGRGLNVQLGATVQVTRAIVERNHEAGVFVAQAGTTAALTDVVVRDTSSRVSDSRVGRGLQVSLGSTVDVQRAVFERNRDVSVLLGLPDTTVSLSDVVIRDTLSDAADQTGGRGIGVQNGGGVEFSRVLVDGSRDIGVLVVRSDAQLEDLVVRDTRAQECASTTCPGSLAGHGISSYDAPGGLRISRFAVLGSALCGLHVARGAGMDADTGEVSGNTIGACVQSEGFDVERITTSVRYLDNDTNLQTVDLPIPGVSAPLDP